MSGETLVQRVAKYCWSNKFLDVFTKYFNDHAYLFEDAPPVLTGGEHNMEFYTLFQDYLKVYEDSLTDYLDTLEVPISEFYQQVREVQEESEDPYLRQFVKCLLASADYESFYRVMAREGRNYKLKKQQVELERRSSKGEPADSCDDDGPSSPARAEAKSTGSYDDDSKGAGGSAKGEGSAKEVDSPRDYK